MSFFFRGDVFDQTGHYTTPTTSGYSRYLPFDWFPRWFSGYYTDESNLKKIYALGLVHWKKELFTIRPGHLTPFFYGPIDVCRAGFSVRTSEAVKEYPNVVFYSNLTASLSGTIRQVDSLGSFYYEKIEPVFMVDEGGGIKLKNLENVSFYVQAATGVLNLTDTFLTYPPLEDSPISFTDQWGDTFSTNFEDHRWSGNGTKFVLGKTAWFKVSYLCKTVRSTLLTNAASGMYVTVDGVTCNLTQYDFENVWDEYAFWHGFKRRANETNVSLKKRCQHLSLTNRLTDRLSAAFGKSQVGYWDQQFSSTYYPDSNGTSVSVWGLTPKTSVEDFPYLDPDNNQALLLKYYPNDTVHLFYDELPVDPTHFVQDGGRLILLTKTLKEASRGQLKARYIINNYDTILNGSNYIDRLARQSSYKFLRTVLTAHDVRVTSSTKRVEHWKWDITPSLLTGSAIFD